MAGGRVGYVVGIDYSLSCPAICIIPSDKTEFKDAQCFFLTDKRKCVGKFNGNITGSYGVIPYDSPEERYENIADWVMLHLTDLDGDVTVFIEDYSMGSKGRVFHIAENCEVLKFMLYKDVIPFKTIPPTVIKKFYQGKGNADKEKMVIKFTEETGIDIRNLLLPGVKLASPVTDIVDSWAIAKYGLCLPI